ncbi:MAG: RNA polymerase sigma factor [Planctomycetota bacterium]|nr:RNA polymerase sigma factor [Planctomycetota bacterium]
MSTRPRWKDADDRSLRELILAGDGAAAEVFFERHLDALYEFVHYRVGGDRTTAEDVVQDTLLVALQGMAGFDGRSTLHTWLCGIAKNKIRAHRRKRRPVLMEDLLDEADAEIHAVLEAVDREPLPDWVLERAETQELVGATLSSLSPEHRRALVDKYVEGLSVADIARKEGKGEKAAESMLHRARLSFARVFQLLAKKHGGFE